VERLAEDPLAADDAGKPAEKRIVGERPARAGKQVGVAV